MVYRHHANTRGLGILIGILLLAICTSGVLAADPSVSITVTKWNIPPLAPTNFEITQTALHSVNITWTPHAATNITIVRHSTDGYPFSIYDGISTYSGNATYVEVGDLDLATYTYYFRAWGQNEYGTSTGYAQGSIGHGSTSSEGDTVAILSLGLSGDDFGLLEVLLVIALMGFALWKKSWIRVLLSTCIIIWGAFAMQYDIKVAAPLLAIGIVLFFMGTLNLIQSYRESREEG